MMCTQPGQTGGAGGGGSDPPAAACGGGGDPPAAGAAAGARGLLQRHRRERNRQHGVHGADGLLGARDPLPELRGVPRQHEAPRHR
eukprot:858556-Pyramimonas_sp.AAC.1